MFELLGVLIRAPIGLVLIALTIVSIPIGMPAIAVLGIGLLVLREVGSIFVFLSAALKNDKYKWEAYKRETKEIRDFYIEIFFYPISGISKIIKWVNGERSSIFD